MLWYIVLYFVIAFPVASFLGSCIAIGKGRYED